MESTLIYSDGDLMRYKIAELITEYTPRFDDLRQLSEPFLYDGDLPADIELAVTEVALQKTDARMAVPDMAKTENFLISGEFNRAIIRYGGLLVHSSGLICNGGAYLFSAASGVGKSTHTRLWLKAFGDKVHIFNDDKPVVRIYDDRVIAYGTPFDGGSGVALNESAPLKAIVFVERAEQNSIRTAATKEIIQNLYFQTAHMVGMKTAQAMLQNFESLLRSSVKFYILSCNMDIEAAEVAYNSIIEK